jgi:zinc protease
MLRFTLSSMVLLVAGLMPAADLDRTKPPVTPPIPNVKLPRIDRFKLPNGLSVIAAEDARFPLVTFEISFLAGSKHDPQNLPGLSDSVAALLNQGTKARTAQQIADQSADFGGEITAAATPDTLTLRGSCLADDATPFLALLADVAQNASFPEDEVQLQKANRTQSLRAERSQPDYLGREELSKALFGDHPYSHVGPTEKALALLTKKDVETFRDKYLVPNNAYLIMVGQLPPEAQLKKTVTDEFGSWKKSDVPAYAPPAIAANKKKLILVDRPGSVQANVFSAHIAPTYGTPEFFPLAVADMILGGGTNSRLFIDIREKRGYAYDAHAETDDRKEAGVVSAVTEVRNEVVDPAMLALNDNLNALAKQDVTATELTDAKNSFAGIFLIRLERQAGLAAQLVRMETMGLPQDYLEMFTTHIRSVEPAQIRQTGKYWSPDDATVVVVGDSQKIEKSLEKYGHVQVIKPKE